MRGQEPSPFVVMQSIELRWWKDARGGAQSTLRNSVPEVLQLPPEPPPGTSLQSSAILYHHVDYSLGLDSVSPRVENWSALPSQLPETTTVELLGDIYSYKRYFGTYALPQNTLTGGESLAVTFDWADFAWAPRRYPTVQRFTLMPGEWATIRFNGRSGWAEGSWEYLKYVLNVCYTPNFSRTIFLDTPLAQRVSDMADLW